MQKIEAIPREELNETGWKGYNMIKVYRGLTLPTDAIQHYRERQEDQKRFRFNGFTSTSLSRDVAVGFATGNPKQGSLPVIFEIFLWPNGFGK